MQLSYWGYIQKHTSQSISPILVSNNLFKSHKNTVAIKYRIKRQGSRERPCGHLPRFHVLCSPRFLRF